MLVRTKDHSKILNFMKCDEGTGTSTASEGGAEIDHATLVTWNTANAVELGSIGTNIALNSGSWTPVTSGTDWAFLMLVNMDDAVLATFSVGDTLSNHSISISAGTNVVITGADGNLDFGGTIGPDKQTLVRVLITVDVDGLASYYESATATDLTAPAATGNSTDFGDLTTIDSDFSASAFSGDVKLYGLTMVEFPNGLPTDIVARANKTFTLWEAGNKVHFPLFEDE